MGPAKSHIRAIFVFLIRVIASTGRLDNKNVASMLILIVRPIKHAKMNLCANLCANLWPTFAQIRQNSSFELLATPKDQPNGRLGPILIFFIRAVTKIAWQYNNDNKFVLLHTIRPITHAEKYKKMLFLTNFDILCKSNTPYDYFQYVLFGF